MTDVTGSPPPPPLTKNPGSAHLLVSNSLDPDQDRHNVGPDLGPNSLQRFSADDKILHLQ